MATPVIASPDTGTAAVTADALLGLLTDHGAGTSVSGTVRRSIPAPVSPPRTATTPVKSAIHLTTTPVVFHGARSSAATKLYWK